MQFSRFFGFLGVIGVISSVHAADLSRLKQTPAPPHIDTNVFVGSMAAGISLLNAPSQTILGGRVPSASAPFPSIGGKFGMMSASRLVGFQIDANVAGAASSWVKPDARSGSTGYVYGLGLHVFTGVVANAKIGAFFTADKIQLNTPRVNESLPSYQGGLEGQYLINPSFMLHARIGGGAFVPEGLLAPLPNIRSYLGGVGLTYAMNDNIRLGADINYSNMRASVAGVSASLGLFDTGIFVEYLFSNAPLSIRADASWLRAKGSLTRRHTQCQR